MARHKKYIIHAPGFCDTAGGCIVLHQLCHTLNSLGERAYLWPDNMPRHKYSGLESLAHPMHTYNKMRKLNPKFPRHEGWNTPLCVDAHLLLGPLYNLDDCIVVYPEVVDGNPLGARHVVRYLMHNPGHFTGHYSFGEHELIYRYSNSFARDFIPSPTSKVSDVLLTLSSMPTCYHREGEAKERKGSAYLIRKGKDKPIVHDMADSVCIDGLPHEEVARILRKVECLYCYDPVTAYTWFAQLCGCRVRVILGNNETPETYRNDSGEHNFIEFTLDGKSVDVDEAYRFATERIKKQEKYVLQSVRRFVEETQAYSNN